jgi:hypothetical protein
VDATGDRRSSGSTFGSVLIPIVFAVALITGVGVATTPTDPADTAATEFEEALDRMPASALDAESAVLYFVDMELAWQRAGVGTDVHERLDQFGSLVALPTWTQSPQLFNQFFTQVDEARAEVGFTMFDIDQEITVQAPPQHITIAETRVDAEAVATALESDPAWSSELSTVEYPDGGYFQWGDDPMALDLARISPMRPFGQGGQLAIVGSAAEATVVRTVDAMDIEAVLSTVAGRADSLLDGDFFATALPALGDGDVLQAMAVDEAIAFDPADLVLTEAGVEALLADMILLHPYRGVVIAEIYNEGQSHTQVLLVHADEAAAEANAALAEQAIAEGLDAATREPLGELLPDAQVSTEGSVVVVTLPFEGAYPLAQRMLTQRSLFPTS